MKRIIHKSLWITIWLITFFIGVTFPGAAYSLNGKYTQCEASNIHRLSVQARRSSPDEIQLKYQFVRRAQSGLPTVIYLPGGPGGVSIGDHSISAYIPDSFGLIQTDPRGAGCNTSRKLKLDDFSTPVLANDILTIIDAEKLQTNKIILVGKSYGTALATTVAYLNAQNGREPFQKIVLEGVLGYGTQNQLDYLFGYIDAGKKYFSQRPGLADKVESVIEKNKVDRKVFARFFTANLFEGTTGNLQEHPLDQPLRWMTDGLNFKVFKENFLVPFQKESPTKDVSQSLWLAITCHELSPLNFEFVFAGGILSIDKSPTGNPLTCKNTDLDRVYDSKKLQLREDLVYLEGSDDPATPLSQALYHFNSQKNAKSKRLTVFNGFGHSVFAWIELRRPGSVKEIWLHDFDQNYLKASLPEMRLDFK